MLPKFISDLANTFIKNDNYLNKLDEICRDIGILSDDGEAWVDKHSGYVIKNIDFNIDEGYDESGFKIKSRAELAEDLSITTAKKNKEEYMSPDAYMINNIILALSNFTGIDLTPDKDFIISNVLIKIESTLPDEKTYKETAEKARLKGKKIQEYSLAQKHSYILLFSIAYIFISIQTIIPTPKTKKTFPGCIKSFSGYPNNNEDYSGLTYIVCIIYNIKSNEVPWNTLKKLIKDSKLKKIKNLIDTFILKDKVVIDKFNLKLSNKDDDNEAIPDQVNVKKWETFLPTLTKITIKSSDPINDDYIMSLYQNMSNNNIIQNEQINIIKGKIISFSIYIQLLINNIIKDSLPLLMNSSKEPFIDNVCVMKNRML